MMCKLLLWLCWCCCFLRFGSAWSTATTLRKAGCYSYQQPGRLVASQFVANDFYLSDTRQIYLYGRGSDHSRYMLYPQGTVVAEANQLVAGSNPARFDAYYLFVFANGQYRVIRNDKPSESPNTAYNRLIQSVNGQNGVLLAYTKKVVVDQARNVYSPTAAGIVKRSPVDNVGSVVAGPWSAAVDVDFFVDANASLYTSDMRTRLVQRWVNGKQTVVAGDTNHTFQSPTGDAFVPCSVLVDSDGNSFVGELRRVSIWPAGSNVGFPVIQFNQTDLLTSPRKEVQMDGDGSLYILPLSSSGVGTNIWKFDCSSCDPCIQSNVIKSVRYNGVYGPRYMGTLSLSTFTGWSQLPFTAHGASDRAILTAMAENEGNLDSVQSYDSEIVTAGAMQKTISSAGQGELPQQVWEFKQENAQVYYQSFEQCGWKVDSKKTISYKGITGGPLKQLLRQGFSTAAVAQPSAPLGSLICAIRTPEFQLKQVKDFISRLYDQVLKLIPAGCNYTIGEYFKSNLGRATALDQHVNRPAYVSADLGAALAYFFQTNRNVTRNPNEWLIFSLQRAQYESEILEYYGVNRRMTDPLLRYNNLKAKLPPCARYDCLFTFFPLF